MKSHYLFIKIETITRRNSITINELLKLKIIVFKTRVIFLNSKIKKVKFI
jgi:hypothetical protein